MYIAEFAWEPERLKGLSESLAISDRLFFKSEAL